MASKTDQTTISTRHIHNSFSHMKRTENRAPNLAYLTTEFKSLIFCCNYCIIKKKKKVNPFVSSQHFFFIHIIEVKYYDWYIILVISLKDSFENDVVLVSLLGYSLHLKKSINKILLLLYKNLFYVYNVTHMFFIKKI